jgi:uncharacterized integral membrane protein
MQFLKTVFWAIVAAVVALFAWVNWNPVTVDLWNDFQADIKLPVLLLIVFLIGWLPTWLVMRARLWGLQRRVEAFERNQAATLVADATTDAEAETVAEPAP